MGRVEWKPYECGEGQSGNVEEARRGRLEMVRRRGGAESK